MKGLSLLLDRRQGDLWIDVNGRHIACIWDVTGLRRDESGHMGILRSGKQIGGVWHAEEIKERWE